MARSSRRTSCNPGLRAIFAVLISTLSLVDVVLSSASGRGVEFIFALPTHLPQPRLATHSAEAGRPRLTLSITPFAEEGPTDVNVTVVSSNWSRALQLQAGRDGSTTVELPPESQAVGSGLQNNTVLVTASRDVSVLALSGNGESTGGFLVRSAGALGADYSVVSYTPVVGEWSEFTVSATEDDTVVQVKLEAPLVFDNAPYGREDLRVSLSRFQTAQFQSSQDLTGTRVRASRPISVVSGSSGSDIPAEFGSAGYVAEHLPPVGAWGTVHALAPFPGRSSGYRCVVVAACSATMVRGFGERVLLSAGDSHEWDAGEHVAVITSSMPVLVAQFSKGTEADERVGVDSGVGGPAMVIVQPFDSLVGGSGALLSTPALPADTYRHISVTSPCNETSGITLNGTSLVPDKRYEYGELDGLCTLQKTLRSSAESSPVISVQRPAPRSPRVVPLAVSVVVQGAGFQGAYAVSASLGAEVSPCEADGPAGCCLADDNFQQVSSLSYDEEGSMQSSDYDLYNSIPDLVVALQSAVDGTTTVSPSQALVTALTDPTNGNSTETENVTEERETSYATVAESNSVSDTELSSRPAEASTDSSNRQTGMPVTLSVPTTHQKITTNSTPGGATEMLASTKQPEAMATVGSAPTGLPITASTRVGSFTEAGLSTTTSTTGRADRPTLSTGVADGPTDSTNPTGTRTSSPSITTAEGPTTSFRPSRKITLSTWLAATLSPTVSRAATEQTTELVIDTCSTCHRPLRILLYGGVAMAALLLLCILICLVKIIRAKRMNAKTGHMKRTNRWVAFPASLSLDELNLGRMKLKPTAGEDDGPITPLPTAAVPTDDNGGARLDAGTNGGLGRGTFKEDSE